MYWTDAQRGVIETSSLDGSGRTVLIDERPSTTSSRRRHLGNTSSVVRPHYYGIALDQRYLYYTDWSRGCVSCYTGFACSSRNRGAGVGCIALLPWIRSSARRI